MKKNLLFILLSISFFGVYQLDAQCTPRSGFYYGQIDPDCNSFTTVTNFGPGQYARVPVITGISYRFSTCGSTINTQITGFQGTNTTTSIYYNNDNGPDCTGTRASVDWTSTFTDYTRMEVSQYNCQPGGTTSATLKVRQNTTVNNTTSTASICIGGTKTLTYSLGGAHNNPAVTWSIVSGGGTISGTTYTAATTGSKTIRATVGVCTDDVTFTVVADPTAPTISGTTTICSGGSATITRTNAGTGGTGTVITQWQRRAGTSGTFVDFGTDNTSSISTGTLTGTYQYRLLREASGSGCGVGTSNTITVTVEADPTAPTISGTTTICSGGSATITRTNAGTGGTGTVITQWQRRAGTSGTFVDFGTDNTSSISTGTLTGTYQYRLLREASGSGCGVGTSNVVTVTVVADPTAPTISGTTTICSGGSATITRTSAGTGGTGTVITQWQRRAGTSGTFVDFGTDNSTSTSTGTLTGTYQYRLLREATGNGCGVGTSNVVTVTVVADPTAPIITKSPDVSSVCNGATLTVSSSGGSGGVSCTDYYRYSIDYGVNWSSWSTSIPSFNGVSGVNAGEVSQIQSKRTCSGIGCGETIGTPVSWSVVPDPVAPIISKNPNLVSVCEGTTLLAVFQGAGYWGTSSCVNEYRYSTDNGATWSSWSSSPQAFTAVLGTNLAQSRRTCAGLDCDTDVNEISWNVEAAPTAPITITGTTFICAGSSTTLTASGGSDGSGATWQWYTGSCGGTLVGGATTASTTVSPSTTTTYYARRVGNTSCTSTTACASVTVTVNGSATTPSGATLPAATATATCVVNDNNWHHFYDTNGDLLASINSNNQNLGSVTVTIEVGNAGPFGTGLAPGVCGYPGASGGEYALARNWDITVDNQPSSPVNVKFYYESSEVTDLTNNIATLPSNSTNYINCWGNVTSESDLMMTVSHTSGGTELFTSLSPVAGPGTGLREIAFALNEFSSGKLHANGGIHTSNPLPVELLSFEARPINNEYIKLSWTTVTEINNEGFELLRSTDGQEFEKIAWIAGNGNTTEQQTYSFNDTKVSNGIYYYKLKQIDFDGESEEFNVISATIKNDFATAEMTVRPIPTSNTITVDVMSVSNTNTTISVFNYAGQRVLEINKELTEGENSLTLEEVSELSSGIYYVNLTVNDKVFTQKFVVSK